MATPKHAVLIRLETDEASAIRHLANINAVSQAKLLERVVREFLARPGARAQLSMSHNDLVERKIENMRAGRKDRAGLELFDSELPVSGA